MTAERLAEIAGVKAETILRLAHELFDLLERDLESQGIVDGGFQKFVSKDEERKKGEKSLSDWEPVHDSIGVTHWLPPRRRANHND